MGLNSITLEMISFLVGCFVVSSIAFLAIRARRQANKYRNEMRQEDMERGDTSVESYVDTDVFDHADQR